MSTLVENEISLNNSIGVSGSPFILLAKGVYKIYSEETKPVHVLNGVNLTIEKGKFIALVGPSGAGKSTLLHILGGLDNPTRGTVVFDNQDIYKLPDSSLAKIRNERIGFVFQFYHLLGDLNVFENVLMPALIYIKHRKKELKEKRELASKLLKDVGLAHRAHHFPSQLSGGEQQRVAIARSLMNKPEMLFCDEPTGNLDSKTGSEIFSLIKKINLDNKTTVILVTHNMELAKIADRVYHLKDGVLVD